MKSISSNRISTVKAIKRILKFPNFSTIFNKRKIFQNNALVFIKNQKILNNLQFHNFTIQENSDKLPTVPSIEMPVYLREVDRLLNHIYETIDIMDLEITENITLSDGVLRISFKKNKHYVLNIQRPNLQVWLSSPFSGPQRFEYNSKEDRWENIRNRNSLLSILEEEFNKILISENSNREIKLAY